MSEKAFVKNAADEEQVRAAPSKERQKRARELADFRVVVSTREGRRFLKRYLDLCNPVGSAFTGETTHQTAFNLGQKNVGSLLFLDLEEASLESWALIQREAKEDEK